MKNSKRKINKIIIWASEFEWLAEKTFYKNINLHSSNFKFY